MSAPVRPARVVPVPAPMPARPSSAPANPLAPALASTLPPAPTVIASLGAPAALSSQVTKTAFAALRLPLFLLPIYQSAGDEYGIPWPVLAAINEVETNYGFDDRTSSAGALGWMQFEPSSWQSYGVDTAGQKTASPYNPADAIYAAAAYLRAAGGQTDVRAAIFAYNHSSSYVDSVMLRAQLIESFPEAMINALTSLSVARAPVPMSAAQQAALATTTVAAAPTPTSASSLGHRRHARHHGPAADITRELPTRAHSPVIAVRDGRVVALGHSRRLGNYVTVADVQGNQFTYSNLQRVGTPPVEHASHDRRARAATPTSHPASTAGASLQQTAASTAAPLLANQLRLLGLTPPLLRVRPGAPTRSTSARVPGPGQWAPLYRGELLSAGGVLGRLGDAHGAGMLRFALRPAGSTQTVDPGPYLTAWNLREKVLAPAQAEADARALRDPGLASAAGAGAGAGSPTASVSPGTGGHQVPGSAGEPSTSGQTANQPAGSAAAVSTSAAAAASSATNPVLRTVKPRAGASDIATWGDEAMFFQSRVTLSSEVLKDRRISIYAGGRQDIAAHRIDRRVLAVLEYLADSGLRPTVSALESGHGRLTSAGNMSEHVSGNAVDIAAVNGVNILGHQGSGSITDITIQRLLALPAGFVPHQIISLMTYNQATNTLKLPDHANHIHVGFHPPARPLPGSSPAAHLAQIAQIASPTSSLSTTLDSGQWQQLTAHLESLGDPPLLLPGASAAPQVSPSNG